MQYDSRREFNTAMVILSRSKRMVAEDTVINISFIRSEYGDDYDTHCIYTDDGNEITFKIGDNDSVTMEFDEERELFMIAVDHSDGRHERLLIK